MDVPVCIGGRALSARWPSAKMGFLDLHADGSKIQVIAQAQNHVGGETEFLVRAKQIKRGDIVGVKGHIGKASILHLYANLFYESIVLNMSSNMKILYIDTKYTYIT